VAFWERYGISEIAICKDATCTPKFQFWIGNNKEEEDHEEKGGPNKEKDDPYEISVVTSL
jgi:hypothetical protein